MTLGRYDKLIKDDEARVKRGGAASRIQYSSVDNVESRCPKSKSMKKAYSDIMASDIKRIVAKSKGRDQ